MQALKSLATMTVAAAALLGAKSAYAGTHGVVFIHGTGDYPGQMNCSGSGSSTKCVVSQALSGYWTQGEIDSVRNGRAYAVVGYAGGQCAPWASGTTTGLHAGSVSDPNYESGCSGSSNNTTGLNLQGGTAASNGDVIAAQIQLFLNQGITDIVLVTHSGGSNQARYILENYTRNSNYTNVKNATKRVVAIAATTDGTYLANEVFSGGVTNFLGGLLGYAGEGVNFIRTNYITTYNGSSSYFAGVNNPVNGVNFYSTGGTSGSTCYGVKVFGVCVGVTGPTLGGSSCDSLVDDVGLLALHTLYMNTNDSSTYRNSCSDGFISCQGSQALGHTFGYAEQQDHNQSRRQCNGLDVEIRATVTGAESGFEYNALTAAQASPTQLDSCGFSLTGMQVNAPCGSNSDCSALGLGSCQRGFCSVAASYPLGCAKTQLGDGKCDPSCVAVYGNDATPTWDGTGTKVISWGSTSDCSSKSNGSDEGNYAWTSSPFNGKTALNNGDSTVWFTDPFAGQSQAVDSCPASLINDGVCDECALANYGSDGTDCVTTNAMSCAGAASYFSPYGSNKSNPMTKVGFLVDGRVNDSYYTGTSYYGGWTLVPYPIGSIAEASGDGICEMGECTKSATWPGTGQCSTSSDCTSGVCVNGGCQSSTSIGSDCTTTYNVPAVTCTENNNCNGDYCVSGTCTLTEGACSTDANCPGPSPATSVCSGGTCTCTTSSDCSNGAACVSGSCATSITQSLCR